MRKNAITCNQRYKQMKNTKTHLGCVTKYSTLEFYGKDNGAYVSWTNVVVNCSIEVCQDWTFKFYFISITSVQRLSSMYRWKLNTKSMNFIVDSPIISYPQKT